MTATLALEEMGEDDVLAFADACARTIVEAEANLLRAAYQLAVLHDPDRLDPAEADRPGRERARRLGGAGTPEVCEFAAAMLGARIGRSPSAAAQLIADALDLHHRLPQPVGPRPGRPGPRLLRPARVQADPRPHPGRGRLCGRRGRRVRRRPHPLDPVRDPGRGQGRRRGTRGRPREGRTSRARPPSPRSSAPTAHGMATFMVRADIATIDAIDAAVTAPRRHADRVHAGRGRRCPPGPRRPAHGPPRRHPRHRRGRPAAHRAALPTHLPRTRPRQRHRGRHRGRPDRPPRGPRPGHPSLDHPGPRPPRQVQDHPGPRPRRPSPCRRLRDPRPT